MNTKRTALWALAALSLAACSESIEPTLTVSDEADTAGPDAGPIEPDAGTDGGAEPEPARVGRVPGRMTVEQLARSIPVITGGIEWIEDFGNGPVDMLQVLAPTLGAPDYLLVTEENLEPSLIIAKFMQDAAARICVKWVARDRAAAAAERTLVTHADWESLDEALVKANLRRLQLRFFARHVPDGEDGPIEDLYDLFLMASTAAPKGSEATDGWLAVCLGLMTDPALLIY